MKPWRRNVVGAGLPAASLIGLVAPIFFATWRAM